MAVCVTRCVCLGPKDLNCLTGLPSPSGFIGAGKIESVKMPVEVTPGIEDLPACPDTLEHTEKHSISCSTGLLFGHAGHDEGG